jgi:hypothetical protein
MTLRRLDMADSIRPVSLASTTIGISAGERPMGSKHEGVQDAKSQESDKVIITGTISSKPSMPMPSNSENAGPPAREPDSQATQEQAQDDLERLGHTSQLVSIFLDETPSAGVSPELLSSLPEMSIMADEKGDPLRVAKQGLNAPVFCKNAEEGTGVFKPFAVDSNPRSAELKRKETVYEITSADIMKHFGIPTITYYEARGKIKGEERLGVYSDYVKNRSLAQDPTLLKEIKNPDETVRGIIFDAWLGNFDRIINNSNIWVKEDNNVIFGDYGCAFRKGVTAFGLPKANLSVMSLYATEANVGKALIEIRSLTDDDIAALVDQGLMHTTLGDESLRDHMVGVLIHNRNELRASNPFEVFYSQNQAEIKLDRRASKEVAMTFIDKYGGDKPRPRAIVKKLYENTYFKDPESQAKVKSLSHEMERLIAGHLRGENPTFHLTPESPDIFNAFINIIFCNLSPQKCMELNMGLYS